MSSTTLIFGGVDQAQPIHHVFIGPATALASAGPAALHGGVAAAVAGGRDKIAKTWDGAQSYTYAALETTTSRNLGTVRSDLLHTLVQKHVPAKEDVQLNLLLSGEDQVFAAASAVARAFPKFSRKSTTKNDAPRTVFVDITINGTPIAPDVYTELNVVGTAVRCAARLVDTPTSELDTTALRAEADVIAKRHGSVVKSTVIVGEALKDAGLFALYGVGKAAREPPALVVLEYTPAQEVHGDTKLSLVGKGIVYDTGGLSIKTTAGMCDMKTDCGGAVALLAAFDALVELKTPFPVVFVGCLAENAVGPDSQRNDDIVTSFSGKTIEINNTDAEGRLVLADGVAWSSYHHKPTHMIDMATLTGAQMIATGMHHAGILSRTKEFEDTVFIAGQRSGDWCFPLVYAPEVLEKEFDSKVADMKNSVKSRMNAQSSCAGHFVERHLHPDWRGAWCHIDIAGPSFREGRATGFGVALVLQLAKTLAQERRAA